MPRPASLALLLVLGLAPSAGCGTVDQAAIDAGDAAGGGDGSGGGRDASSTADGAPGDTITLDGAGPTDGGLGGEGQVCDDDPASAPPACQVGLACCYPCGIPGCENVCTVRCTPGPACPGGCPLAP